MYDETITAMATAATKKSSFAVERTTAFMIHSAMAGAYVGLGISLIFAFGTPLAKAHSPALGLAMAATFGISQSLVIFAGSELFSANALIMPLGALSGKTTWTDAIHVLVFSYFGNLLGAFIVAYCVILSGTFKEDPSFILAIAAKRMAAPFWSLFFKGILANWLIVLAAWCSFRLKSEVAKLIMIWWCMLGFIGTGYEHGIANMTLLTIANLLPNSGDLAITWTGWFANMVPVTLGNFAGGAVLVAGAYFFVSPVTIADAPKVETPFGKRASEDDAA
jgi:nitrite transporter NirC